MNPPRYWFPACCAAILLAGCARTPSGHGVHATGYPYQLALGHSVYHVECESEADRLTMSFVRWVEKPGEVDAVFRVTNPGKRAVLVWNVRQQSRGSGSGAPDWSTHGSDYPGRGWDRAAVPAGGSVEFPMASLSEGVWRVCLLYSRESTGPTDPGRQFSGTFEVVGPAVQEEEESSSASFAAPKARAWVVAAAGAGSRNPSMTVAVRRSKRALEQGPYECRSGRQRDFPRTARGARGLEETP